MCGIAGILFKGEHPGMSAGQALIDMLDGCQHRGPDSTGFADVAIVHNAQITNYWKMRRRLEKRSFEFRTDNDSELIAVYLADNMLSGSVLANGNAGERVGESMTGGSIYVAGRVQTLGSDAERTDLPAAERDDILAFLDHYEIPFNGSFQKIANAGKQLRYATLEPRVRSIPFFMAWGRSQYWNPKVQEDVHVVDTELHGGLSLAAPLLVAGFDQAPHPVRQPLAAAMQASGVPYLGSRTLGRTPWPAGSQRGPGSRADHAPPQPGRGSRPYLLWWRAFGHRYGQTDRSGL